MTKELGFPTAKKRQLLNITDQVKEAVAQSKVEEGICLVFVPHATAAADPPARASGAKRTAGCRF